MQALSRWRDRAVITTQIHDGLRPGPDVAGLVLLGALALVAVLVSIRTGTDAGSFVALLGAVAGVVVVSAMVGARTHRALVPAVIAIGATWLAWRWRLDLATGPVGGPFGYRNASGAFLATAAVAWLMAGAALRRWPAIVVTVAVALALSAVAVRNADAAAAVGLAFVALAIALVGPRASRVAIAAMAAVFVVSLAATVWLAATYDPAAGPTGLAESLVDVGLTERRFALWHDAWDATTAEPRGNGLGTFALVSPTAHSDRDAFQAHHEFLERGAELGVLGLLLMVAVFGWAFLRLLAVPRPDAVTALGAAAVAVVGIHACVDYVLHTPAVVLIVAALLGTALVPRREEHRW
jgi:O-antigen ligase